MVCYTIPLIAAVVHYGLRKKVVSWKKSVHHLWLSLLLMGGAVFGVVDHLWNGELFLIGENVWFDLLLGVTITATIMAVWVILVVVNKSFTKKVSQQVQ